MSVFKKHYSIEPMNFDLAGQMSSDLKRHLKQMNFSFDLIKRICVAAYEAEINIVIHSMGGYADVWIDENEVMLQFIDCGPGIPDIDLALTPGFTTANELVQLHGFGAGMGLNNISSCADDMRILSDSNGTVLKLKFFIKED